MENFAKLTKTITVRVKSLEKTDDVEKKLSDMEGIVANLGKALIKDKNLDDGQELVYEKKNGSNVHVNLHLGYRVPVTVKLWTGKIVPLDVHSWDTARDIKMKLEEKEGVQARQLTLIQSGKQLKDMENICYPRRYSGNIIYAALLGDENIKISIRSMPGTVELEVKVCSSVENVKHVLHCMTGYPIDDQKLSHGGELLENRRTLWDYGIKMGSLLDFEYVQPAGDTKIYLQGLTGKRRIYYVNKSDTVNILMMKIQYNDGVPLEHQRLVYGTKSLEPDLTIGYYNIMEEDTVSFVLRLCGC